MKILEPKGFDGTTYHAEGIECEGCKKKFSYTVKNREDGERYCKLCFNHRFGSEEMEIVQKKFDQLGNYLWETPITDLSLEMKEKLTWVSKSNADL